MSEISKKGVIGHMVDLGLVRETMEGRMILDASIAYELMVVNSKYLVMLQEWCYEDIS